jgi:hypothetical protein
VALVFPKTFTHLLSMTRDQVETAINEGLPFQIRMADGEKYEVVDNRQIAIGRTSVALFQDDIVHVLPLLTMTGITYLSKKGKR